MHDVNTEEVREAVIADIKAGLAPMIVSSPGMGKSQIVKSIADEYGLKLIDLRISQCEPVDMQGYPDTTEDGRMTFKTPEYFPLENDPIPEGYNGWLLFLDEFNSGNKQTEAAAYKLILDREVYLKKLHPRCAIVAAGNRVTDQAIASPQSTATMSRMVHYSMVIESPKYWLKWANKEGIDQRIISLIKFKPELLHRFDPGTAESNFPCPRTWEFGSKIITPVETIDELTTKRLAGALGGGAAIELKTYAKIYETLPTIEEVMANPSSGWKVPSEPSEQFAVTTMLSHHAEPDTAQQVLTAMKRLPMDFQVVTMRDIYSRAPELKKHELVQKWISENASVMF